MDKQLYKKIINMPMDDLCNLISETNKKILEDTNKLMIMLEVRQERISEININIALVECENPNCNKRFVKRKRQKYCSNACKQEHYRIRKAL